VVAGRALTYPAGGRSAWASLLSRMLTAVFLDRSRRASASPSSSPRAAPLRHSARATRWPGSRSRAGRLCSSLSPAPGLPAAAGIRGGHPRVLSLGAWRVRCGSGARAPGRGLGVRFWTMTAGSGDRPRPRRGGAQTLAPPRTRAFLTVSLPLAVPGIVASALLVFLYSLGRVHGHAPRGGAFVTTLPCTCTRRARATSFRSPLSRRRADGPGGSVLLLERCCVRSTTFFGQIKQAAIGPICFVASIWAFSTACPGVAPLSTGME